MFWKTNPIETQLDKTIEKLELEIHASPDMSDKAVGKKVKVLGELYSLRNKNESKSIDPNTFLLCLTNLLGILFILGYEHAHPVVSKALGFAGKLR